MGEVAQFVGRRVMVRRSDMSDTHASAVVDGLAHHFSAKLGKEYSGVANAAVLPSDMLQKYQAAFLDHVRNIAAENPGLPMFAGYDSLGRQVPSAHALAMKRHPAIFELSRCKPADLKEGDADVEVV